MQGEPFGDLLKTMRKRKRLSQQALAERLGVHRNTIGNWEQGVFLPDSKGMVLELAKQLSLDDQGTRQLLEASLTAVSSYWNVPFARNPFFTGRDSLLQGLHTILTQHSTSAALTQSSALYGLGGIGKTQAAVEYAYRHRAEYDAVFWIEAETQTTLASGFVALADLLSLPERVEENDQSKIVAAVLRWLNRHQGWLLIFDNVEDLALLKQFLPASGQGAILLTTRLQTLGTVARTVELAPMTGEEGMDFLLARAMRGYNDAFPYSLDSRERAAVQEIVVEMAGLPLALDQAGAYIDAVKCSFSDYLRLLRLSQYRLLDEYDPASDHPLSVSRTFILAFERIKQRSPAATTLLTVCAFLAPDAIPETFFLEGASSLGPTFETFAVDPLQFQNALKELLTYSLLQRQPATRTMTMHRLVQVVLKGQLSEAEQRTWAKRVIETMSQIFPSSEDGQSDYWPVCERLLPHALLSVELTEQRKEHEVYSISLMNHVATYLFKRARYVDAEELFQRAAQIGKQILGPQHPLVAEALHGVADLWAYQGRWTESEALFLQVIGLREQALGAEHPQVAESLDRLGLIYYRQHKYEQAEPLFQRALHIWEQALGAPNPLVAQPLNGLGLLYYEQSMYEKAEPLFQRALHVMEQALGSEQPRLTYPLGNLGILYYDQGKYEQAEPLFQRVLQIREHTLGLEHPLVAEALNNLAELYRTEGKYKQAEPLLQRAVCVLEQALGPQHPDITYPLHGLASFYREQKEYEQAGLFFQRALAIRQQHLGSQHPETADILHDLAGLQQEQQQYEEARSHYQQALAIREETLGMHHPKTRATRTAYTQLLREMGCEEEVVAVEGSKKR